MKTWSLPPKLHKYIYKKNIDRALGYLSKITAINDKGLFSEEDENYLRYVGVFRVRLLMEWGYYREALAWACLEVELYPQNRKAIIFKENLKRQINNLPKGSISKSIKTNDGWEGVAGMREIKTIIEQDIIMPFKNPALYKRFKVPLPNGYLFYGPPGCGKTFFAKSLAKKLNINFINISPSDIGSPYVHGTQLEIKRVFEDAKKQSPCLLFFDEFESIAPSRKSSEISFSYKSEVNELLTQLDNISKKEILFIAATNYIRNIDEAILRPGRIDKNIFIGPPDLESRIESFKIQLQERPMEKINFEYISEMSNYFTHADIEFVCNEASRLAIKKKSLINTDLLGSIVYNYQPRLNDSKIQDYYQ